MCARVCYTLPCGCRRVELTHPFDEMLVQSQCRIARAFPLSVRRVADKKTTRCCCGHHANYRKQLVCMTMACVFAARTVLLELIRDACACEDVPSSCNYDTSNHVVRHKGFIQRTRLMMGRPWRAVVHITVRKPPRKSFEKRSQCSSTSGMTRGTVVHHGVSTGAITAAAASRVRVVRRHVARSFASTVAETAALVRVLDLSWRPWPLAPGPVLWSNIRCSGATLDLDVRGKSDRI